MGLTPFINCASAGRKVFPGGSFTHESACSAGDPHSIPGLGRSPGEGNDNPLQYSCLENSVDRGAWWATVLGVMKSWTWLSYFTFTLHWWQTEWKTTVTENESNWSLGLQPCLTQWNYEPCCVGPPRSDGSWWRVLTKCGSLEEGMANHFSTHALRIPWMAWKCKKIWHWKMNSPGR